LHTCGKALGTAGALVTGNRLLLDFLVNRAQPFIYATAPSPLLAATVREALKILADEPERREKLLQLIAFANQQLTHYLAIEGSGSQILPVVIGDNGRAVRIARRMQMEGFDIRAIRPPTVPEGTARLRISITLNVDAAKIIRMFDRLSKVMADETP
jgi:8-amino-7-oxononanoate synthase